MKDYNVVAEYISRKYIKRISGRDFPERVVGDNPELTVMVGTLAEERVEQAFDDGYKEDLTRQFESIPSISLSFQIDKNASGKLKIVPRGLLFYTVLPQFEEIRDYIMRIWSERDHMVYSNIQELLDKYPNEHYELPQVYKKVEIEKVLGEGIEISLENLKAGKQHLEERISERLNLVAGEISEEICIVRDADIYFNDLVDEDHFKLKCSAKPEAVNAHWAIDILLLVSEDEDTKYVTLQMVNNTPKSDRQNIGYLPRIFDAGMDVIAEPDVEFKEIDLKYFKSSFKKREAVYAVAENASVEYDKEKNKLTT